MGLGESSWGRSPAGYCGFKVDMGPKNGHTPTSTYFYRVPVIMFTVSSHSMHHLLEV